MKQKLYFIAKNQTRPLGLGKEIGRTLLGAHSETTRPCNGKIRSMIKYANTKLKMPNNFMIWSMVDEFITSPHGIKT